MVVQGHNGINFSEVLSPINVRGAHVCVVRMFWHAETKVHLSIIEYGCQEGTIQDV